MASVGVDEDRVGAARVDTVAVVVERAAEMSMLIGSVVVVSMVTRSAVIIGSSVAVVKRHAGVASVEMWLNVETSSDSDSKPCRQQASIGLTGALSPGSHPGACCPGPWALCPRRSFL
jgi:hypothetical protein